MELKPGLRQFWLLFGWLLILFVVYMSLTPSPMQLPVEQGDKFSHTLAYLGLMSWFANLYEGRTERVMLAAGFMVMGVGLEYAQRWTGIRSFEVLDMAAGIAGVIVAWLIAPPRLPNCLHLLNRL